MLLIYIFELSKTVYLVYSVILWIQECRWQISNVHVTTLANIRSLRRNGDKYWGRL